jgi:ribosomal protein L30E
VRKIAYFGRAALVVLCQNVVSWILNRLFFTIEISGRSILTFDGSDLEMAEQLGRPHNFRLT